MAITNSDGSIILTTKVEDAGLKKGMAKIISDQKMQLQSLTREYAKLITNNKQNTEEAKKLKDQIDKLSKSIKENEIVLKSFGKTSASAFARVGSALKSIAGYLALAFSVTKIIQFSKESASLAIQTEASVQRLVDIYGSASDSVGDFIDQNARALGMSKSAAASFSSVYGNLFSVWADQATNAQLTNEYLRMTAVVASKTGRSVEDVQERVRSGLLGNTEAIEDLGIFVNVKTIEMTDAFQRMANGKSWEQLDAYTQQQIRSMAILEQATAKYGDEVADTSSTLRNRFNAAYQDFQNSWGLIVNQILLPVLQTLTQIFNIATAGLNALSGRSGKILENAQIQEESTDKTAKNIEEQAEAQKDLNKEMKKTLAGFDDIQILSSQTAENTGGGDLDSGLQGISGDLGGSLDGSAYVEEIDKTLTAIMGIVALSLAALGLILLFTGHISWGIGFIIAGAFMLTVTEASVSKFKEKGVIQLLNTIMGVAGGALLALGIILLCIGGVVGKGIAIGMIIAGGASLVSAVSAQAAFAPEDVSAWLSLILGIAGGALLALGIILCMVGSVPLGVGMIIAGAISLVSAVALNFDSVKNSITGWVAVIMAIAGGAMLALGVILCASGVALPLGIALIAAGATALVTPIALNWNGIVDWVKGAWEAVKSFWNKYIAPVFTAKWWLDLGKKALNGLISAFESALNFITGGLRALANGAIELVNTIGGAIGLNWDIPTIPKISLPRLAQGTVVPPNKEFMAILGDNTKEHEIVSPVSTMKQAFMEAMLEMSPMGQTTKEEHYYFDETELMSIVYRLFKGGERLNGRNLEDGGY